MNGPDMTTPEGRAGLLTRRVERGEQACRYFALCDNTATHLRDCGPLGKVPTCDRCGDKIDRVCA